MALKLYRRHRMGCEGGHPEGSFSGEFEDGRRGRKRCACGICVSGTLAGKFNRKQTGKSDWAEAKTVVAVWREADSWDGKVLPPPSPQTEGQTARVTLAEAFRVFVAIHEGEEITPSTLRKYRTFVKQLGTFAESRGYVMLDQFTPGDIDRFYGDVSSAHAPKENT